MEFAFVKQQARQERYQIRAKTARFYARIVMFALICTTGVAAWQDDTYGPMMRDYAVMAMDKFEAATDEDSTGRKLVEAAKSKLQL